MQADLISQPGGEDAGRCEVNLGALARATGQQDAPVARLLIDETVVRSTGALQARDETTLRFHPFRVLMQDYAGMPALLDMAALRQDAADAGADPQTVRLARRVDLVIDHSVINDAIGPDAERTNILREYAANTERYSFLRWAEQAFEGLAITPPGEGIVHQVNLERLCEPVRTAGNWLVPDSLVGTDSHSTMAGAMGLLAWGVGGIEATSVLLGNPVELARPEFVGVELVGAIPDGVLATDLALRLTAFLRSEGVVGTIVEFHGEAVEGLSVQDRATVANMAPEYGATCALFPPDARTVAYLLETGRTAAGQRLARWLRRHPILATDRPRRFDRTLRFDLSSLKLTVAGPSLPHQTLEVNEVGAVFANASARGKRIADGDIVLAALTSCTNTANPAAMIAAGLTARAALERGLALPAHVRASFSPGSRQVTDYLGKLGLLRPLEELGFWVTGYGCMTCVGNSGDLDPDIRADIESAGLNVAAVLSGNRNFQSRIHPSVRSNFLASPPLVVALALAGNLRFNPSREPIARDVYLRDLLPTRNEIDAYLVRLDLSAAAESPYRSLWDQVDYTPGPCFDWPARSGFIRRPVLDTEGPGETVLPPAKPLLVLGDNVTTDHISPVGRILPGTAAADYLRTIGVEDGNLGTYGARRGNPDVMLRGTFAHPFLLNKLGTGANTRHANGETMPIHIAATDYQDHAVPLVVIAGENYGIGSARDWAAKGTRGLGVRAVIAKSFERIHRSNLALLGVLPVVCRELPEIDESMSVAIDLAPDKLQPHVPLELRINSGDGEIRIPAICGLHTDFEIACWRKGGLLARGR